MRPEFEVRLSSVENSKIILIDAGSELPKAAALAKKYGAAYFELRRPVSERWVHRD